MFKDLLIYLKLFLKAKIQTLTIKLLELERQKLRASFRLELNKLLIQRRLDARKLDFAKIKRPLVKDFESGWWTHQSGADLALDSLIEKFQVENQILYKRELSRWSMVRDGNYSQARACRVIFSNDLVSILDPKDKVVELLIKEVANLTPHLLVHPNEDVRKLAQKYLEGS